MEENVPEEVQDGNAPKEASPNVPPEQILAEKLKAILDTQPKVAAAMPAGSPHLAASVSPQEVLLWIEVVKLILGLLSAGGGEKTIEETVNEVVEYLPEETQETAKDKLSGILAWIPVVTAVSDLIQEIG